MAADGKVSMTSLQEAYASFDRDGVRAFEQLLAPEVEFLGTPNSVAIASSPREQVLARMEELGWQDWHMEPQDFVEFGDRIVVPMRQVRRKPQEGGRPERQRAHYWRIGPDGAERLEEYVRRADAVNAAVGYFALLERLHARLRPRTYVEIGVHLGRSLGRVSLETKAIGIDPDPIFVDPGVDEMSTIYRMTSDEFFAQHDLRSELGGLPVDLAFIDGMHLFEFALRDFINLERYCTDQSVILVHDCYPAKRVFAERERVADAWSGDVWKLVPCLRERRPDLNVAVVDIRPAGMGIVTSLDPDSSVLADTYDEIAAHYLAFDYDWVEENKAERLARIDREWETIEPLLPPARRD